MTIFYIILGILVGVPVYLLLNTVLALFSRPFAAIAACLMGGSFRDEIKAVPGRSMVEAFGRTVSNLLGWMMFMAIVCVLVVLLIYRFCWLVYQFFRLWWNIVKFFWNLGVAKKKIRIRKR